MLLKILLGLTCVFFLSSQAVAQGEMKSVLEELERRIDRGRAVVGDCVTGDCGGQAAVDGEEWCLRGSLLVSLLNVLLMMEPVCSKQ